MSPAEIVGLVMAGCALFGVFLQAVAYAYREGDKHRRLLQVEERVRGIPALEMLVSAMTANVESFRLSIADLKSDLKGDVATINQTIRDHLLAKPSSRARQGGSA